MTDHRYKSSVLVHVLVRVELRPKTKRLAALLPMILAIARVALSQWLRRHQ